MSETASPTSTAGSIIPRKADIGSLIAALASPDRVTRQTARGRWSRWVTRRLDRSSLCWMTGTTTCAGGGQIAVRDSRSRRGAGAGENPRR